MQSNVYTVFTVVTIIWLSILLLQAGDIHPNPCPLSTSSDSSISDTSSTNFSVLKFSALSNHLSFVHYNMQCLVLKIDISATEPIEFDILAFSETLLNPSVLSQDVHIQTFRETKCKNRVGDSHGGVVLYVKENVHYRRRLDLEPRGVECNWIELSLKQKHVLFGLFFQTIKLRYDLLFFNPPCSRYRHR